MKTIGSIKRYYGEHTSLCNALLILGWLTVNLLQAGFTELTNDEAYYWMYSRNLDYGYFDHPPAIALLIKAGYALFHNEFGLRLFTVISGAFFLWFTFLLTNRRNFVVFFLLFCSVSLFESYSFIAVPDAPLLCFTAAFFLLYKRYLDTPNGWNVLLLSLCISALMYCKYHGLLILFFTLLSNLSLFRRGSFYAVIALSVLAYFPHIAWQVVNDYPSYRYHVLTKSQDPWKPLDTLAFITGQLLVAGPLTGWFLFYASFRYKTANATERALKFTLSGFVIFFLFSTLNAPVEANWTAAAFVPMVVLAANYTGPRKRAANLMMGLSSVSLILFLVFRLNLALNFAPAIGSKAFPEFYGWKKWAQEIRAKAGDTPVVFANSYQKASKYTFYSGKTGLSLNNVQYRRNQFDLWSIEDSLQGKRVLYIPNWETAEHGVQAFQTEKENVLFVFIDNFRSYAKIAITTPEPRYTFKAGSVARIPVTLHNNYPQPVTFNKNADFPDQLVCCVFRHETFTGEQLIMPLKGVVIDREFKTQLLLEVPRQKGTYYIRIAIRTGWLPSAINSRLIRVTVT